MSFICPACRRHRSHTPPHAYRGESCLNCGATLIGEVRPPPEGWEHFDHTFTPDDAMTILARIPADSYHWADIERIGNGRVEEYTRIMAEGRWLDETFELGFQDHPIRFNAEGDITHGVIRLLACYRSERPFRSCVAAPVGVFPGVLR